MNQYIASGWLTADPDFGPTKKGQFCNFTLGVLEYRYKDDKGNGLFVPMFCYDDTAERIKKTCVKGSYIVLVSAKLAQQDWINKEGQKRSQLKVQLFQFEAGRFGTGKENEQGITLKEAYNSLPFDN